MNVSSTGGVVGNWSLAFAAQKAGVTNLTRKMAVTHAAESNRVICICPGFIATSIIRGLSDDPEALGPASARHPMGRIGQAEEVAATAAFLASGPGRVWGIATEQR